MNPATAIFTSLIKSFTYRGRASRSEFWWFQALRIVVMFAFLYALGLLMRDFALVGANDPTFRILTDAVISHQSILLITSSLILILLPASYASSVRRLHDRGHPGWPMWTVFIASLTQIYVFLILLVYIMFSRESSILWMEGVTQTFVDFIDNGGNPEALIGFGVLYFLLSIVGICLFVGPLYFIFFTVQACLPSLERENRHGPVPNTPSHNEVFQ